MLYAQNGIWRPPGNRNSLQHFIRFFWLKVQGSMKSWSMIMNMNFESPCTSSPPSGNPQAEQENENSRATFSELSAAEDDHNPSSARRISAPKSGITRLEM